MDHRATARVPVFKVRVTGVMDPDPDIMATTITTTKATTTSMVRAVITTKATTSMVRVVTITKAISSVNSNSNPDIRVIRRS